MSTKVQVGSSGIGLETILFIIFLILKLTGNITWSWWWVTAPLWIPCVILIAIAISIIAIAIFAGLAALIFH